MSYSQNYSAPNLVIPYTMPSNIPASLVPIIKPLYLAFQSLVQTLVTYCGIAPRPAGSILSSLNDPSAILANNMHRFYVQATETIAAGAAINLVGAAGNLGVQNANATDNTKPCDGFCSQPGGLVLGAVGEVILNDGVNDQLVGLTVGASYYLAAAPGQYTTAAPTATGNLQQSVGKALSPTALRFWTGHQVQH